jgi:hypothetical protein
MIDSKGWAFGLFWSGKAKTAAPKKKRGPSAPPRVNKLSHAKRSYLQRQVYQKIERRKICEL